MTSEDTVIDEPLVQVHGGESFFQSKKSESIFFLKSTIIYFQGTSKVSVQFWESIFLSTKLALFSAAFAILFCWVLLHLQRHWPKRGMQLVWYLSLFLSSVPALFLGPFAIYIFCYQWDLLTFVFDDTKFLTWVLPAIVMSSRPCGLFLRFWIVRVHKLRGSPWVQYFQSMGVSDKRIEEKFLSREIMIPLLALIPQLLMNLFSGSLIVEWLFSVPGIGREMKLALETKNHSLFVALLLVVFSISFSLRHFFRNMSFRMDPRSRDLGHL